MISLTLLDQHGNSLKNWQFSEESVIRIGRFPDNDVVLANFLAVSRHHLQLRQLDAHRWRLVSQGANGTFLNGIVVTEALLPNKALIQLAKEGPILKVQIQAPQCNHAHNPPNSLFCIHCGQALVEQAQFIRDYQILKTLGRGGMGTTYLAWDKQGKITGDPLLLVLKEMNADMAQIAKARELFDREARVLQSLNHPGIPKYYDFFVENDQKYLAMELVHGQNLEHLIHQQGPVSPKQAIQWMLELCNILNYLHSLNPPLVHRDIKPANLMRRNLGHHLVLLDFGAVKEIGTPMGTRIGAEGYTAPEQERGKPCPQSDIYAVGPTLIFLMTGESPLKYYRYQGTESRFVVSNIPTITPQLAKVIEKTCEYNLSVRYQNAQDLSQALIACLEN